MVELSYSSESEDLPLVVVGDVVGVVPSKSSRKILRLVRTYGVSSEAKAHELVGNHDEAVVGRDDVLVGRGDDRVFLVVKVVHSVPAHCPGAVNTDSCTSPISSWIIVALGFHRSAENEIQN